MYLYWRLTGFETESSYEKNSIIIKKCEYVWTFACWKQHSIEVDKLIGIKVAYWPDKVYKSTG